MTTLIRSQIGSDNARRCDAHCYDATHAHCECVCGGMNHGKGLDVAREQTAAATAEMVRAIEARGGIVAEDVHQAVMQFLEGTK